MQELFQEYDQKYESLKDLFQDELPRSLRLFNIRFRLAMDIQVNFKGEVSLTKSKSVRDTYVKIIRLMELWNAYEALIVYAKELDDYITPRANKAKAFSQSVLEDFGSTPLLLKYMAKIKNHFDENPRFKKDLLQYLDRIINDERIKKTLTNDANNFKTYLHKGMCISGTEIISLIYTERNMYYHHGETAKMGMSYTNRKKLLDIFWDCLSLHSLKSINFILEKEIGEHQ